MLCETDSWSLEGWFSKCSGKLLVSMGEFGCSTLTTLSSWHPLSLGWAWGELCVTIYLPMLPYFWFLTYSTMEDLSGFPVRMAEYQTLAHLRSRSQTAKGYSGYCEFSCQSLPKAGFLKIVSLYELCQECLLRVLKSRETARSHHPSNQKTCRNDTYLFGPVHCVSNTVNGTRLPKALWECTHTHSLSRTETGGSWLLDSYFLLFVLLLCFTDCGRHL